MLESRRWLTPWSIAIAGLSVACLALVWVDMRATSRPSVSNNQVGAIVDKKVGTAIGKLQAAPDPGVDVYNTIRGPLVVIEASHPGRAKEGDSDLGSGVVVNTQGDILTSLHVVQGAASIQVSFSDGSQSAAIIKSSDPDHDSAVLTAAQLPQVIVPAVLGSTSGLRVGDDTFAVGHPLGLLGSLSAGVISGFDRTFPLPDGRTLNGLIQFDAAVNPGNSGGPLLNKKGQVIGIVTGLANPAGANDFVGIGFAEPIGSAGGAAGAPGQ